MIVLAQNRCISCMNTIGSPVCPHCGSPAPDDPLAQLLVEPGKLTVAVSPDLAPMESVDPTKSGQDQFVGLDMSFARYLASELELEPVLMPISFDGCQQAVQDRRVDMATDGIEVSYDDNGDPLN